ncbi:hypothetical protein SAMN05421640_2490 [Ekhidna lutea]|uniref:YD repeat-containing protein n=1 Tax=Ekhidna lutea TaxID=447679 RepID=A0A239K767_EKHLU|nr:DUF6443 domain-containing protein [Ekhidna lutea]SNT14306.1 hypothetical protein SAMN05421640_2490 [Ekhidna lutea]
MKYLIASILVAFGTGQLLYSQNVEHFEKVESISFSAGASHNLSIDFEDYPVEKRIKNGFFKVSLDLGSEYLFGSEDFQIDANFTLTALNDGVAVDPNIFDEAGYTLTIVENQPEAYVILDFNSYKEDTDGYESLLFDEVQITLDSTFSSNSNLDSYIRLQVGYEVNLLFDIGDLQSMITGIDVSSATKSATFNWTDNIHVSHYQLQVLRLHNISSTKPDENNIITSVDWRRATTIDIDLFDPNNKEFQYQLAGGTGFYAARIRPVGGYLPGGSGNSGNWGEWSEFLYGTGVELSESDNDIRYFYFEDSEDNVNWIYSRVFTEDTKIKENITYADGLLKVKQEQTYLPSKNITLIQQTVYDQVGRPAITSIPVPVPQKQASYRTQFMQAAGADEVFQAKHFDMEDKLRSPDPVDENGDFSYYSNNPDKSIANAEGYGYTRTIYYNDGTNRVKEQSGVGKIHSVDETAGGRTTRYLYATPTEGELIAIFGDEAPASESVLKTVTIDPNNTTSVTYTSKEGNVIATSLVFSEDDDNLHPLDNSNPYTQELEDKITANLKKEGSFVSSKRLALAVPTNLNVGYSIKCQQLSSLCIETTIDCNFQLNVLLHKLGEQGDIISSQTIHENVDLGAIGCQDVGGDQFKIVDPIVLENVEPGSYIIEKVLSSAGAEANQEQNRETIENGVYPITNLVADWLESIETVQQIKDFNQAIYGLAVSMEDKTNANTLFNYSGFGGFTVDFNDAAYEDFRLLYEQSINDYSIVFNPDPYNPNTDGNPIQMFLNTPCCPWIEIPVKWLPELDCEEILEEIQFPVDADNDGNYNVVYYYDLFDTDKDVEQEFFPDFEGYMLAFFDDCIGENRDFSSREALKNLVYRGLNEEGEKVAGYMDGWQVEGTFNMMIYHMLTDTYDLGEGVEESPYECDDLINCWIGVLSRLKEEICQSTFDFYQDGDRNNVSNTFDGRNDDDPSVHDGHFNSNFKGGGFFLTRWIAKRKISKRMRGLQLNGEGEGEIDPVLGQFHLVDEFLQCTGYQFAKIQTPFDGEPLAEDQVDNNRLTNDFEYVVENRDGSRMPVPVEVNSITYSAYFYGDGSASNLMKVQPSNTDDYEYKYVPISDWDPIKRIKEDGVFVEPTTARKRKSVFPMIKNPIYAFKYFIYDEHGKVDDRTGLAPYQVIEQSVCYVDPNDCYQVDVDGYIVLDGLGQPIKVPCCSESPGPGATGCFEDTNYPGGTKLIVDDFLGTGRLECEETHLDWSAPQRLAFYDMVASYDPDATYDDRAVTGLDLRCEDLEDENASWYAYTGDDQIQIDNDLADLINQEIYDQISGFQSEYTQIKLTNEDGSTRDNFAYFELEIENRISECQSGCENLRNRFQSKLFELFNENCYIIDGCRTDHVSTHNVIPIEDVEAILDQLVISCQEQCVMTTYSCEESSSRPLDVPVSEVSIHDQANPNYNSQLSLETHYGVGGYPNPATSIEIMGDPEGNTSSSYNYDDNSLCAEIGTTGIKLCDLKDDVDRTIKNLSWYEYTLLKQVESWDFELDIKSFCDDAPVTWQYEAYQATAPNSSRGSTYVPKERYEVDGAAKLKGFDPGDQAVSPVKCIYVQVEPEN